MLFEELRKKKHDIECFVKHYGASNIRVFGSVARYEETENSDIDFVVEFQHGYDMFNERMPLMEELSILTGRKVEVIPEHELNKHIKNDVLREARPL